MGKARLSKAGSCDLRNFSGKDMLAVAPGGGASEQEAVGVRAVGGAPTALPQGFPILSSFQVVMLLRTV